MQDNESSQSQSSKLISVTISYKKLNQKLDSFLKKSQLNKVDQEEILCIINDAQQFNNISYYVNMRYPNKLQFALQNFCFSQHIGAKIQQEISRVIQVFIKGAEDISDIVKMETNCFEKLTPFNRYL